MFVSKTKRVRISIFTSCFLFLTLLVGYGCKQEVGEPTPEPSDPSLYINVEVSDAAIGSLDRYASCPDDGKACVHRIAVALGFEQNGRLRNAEGTTLYENFVETFASGPLI